MHSDIIAAELDLPIDYNSLIHELKKLVSPDWDNDCCHLRINFQTGQRVFIFELKNNPVSKSLTKPQDLEMTIKELNEWAESKKIPRLFSNFPRQVDENSIIGFFHSKTFEHKQYKWVDEYDTTHLQKFLTQIPHKSIGPIRIMSMYNDLYIHNDVDENTIDDISYKLTLLINLKMPDPFTMIDPKTNQQYQFQSPALLINHAYYHGFVNTSGQEWLGFSVNAEFDFDWLLKRAIRIVRTTS